jgi:hypothetical protein
MEFVFVLLPEIILVSEEKCTMPHDGGYVTKCIKELGTYSSN